MGGNQQACVRLVEAIKSSFSAILINSYFVWKLHLFLASPNPMKQIVCLMKHFILNNNASPGFKYLINIY